MDRYVHLADENIDQLPKSVSVDVDYQFNHRRYLSDIIFNIKSILERTGGCFERSAAAYIINTYKVHKVTFIKGDNNEFAASNNNNQVIVRYPSHWRQLVDIIDSIPDEAISISTPDILIGEVVGGEKIPLEYFVLIFIAHIEKRINIQIFKPRLVDLLPTLKIKSSSVNGKIRFS